MVLLFFTCSLELLSVFCFPSGVYTDSLYLFIRLLDFSSVVFSLFIGSRDQKLVLDCLKSVSVPKFVPKSGLLLVLDSPLVYTRGFTNSLILFVAL